MNRLTGTLFNNEDCQFRWHLLPIVVANTYFVTGMVNCLRWIGFCALLVSAAIASAQDAVFSQFYAAPLLLNPAFAGMTQAPSIALNHRSQYVGFAGGVPYQTYAVSYGQFAPRLNSGFGVSLFADQAGDNIVSTYAGTAYYAYQVEIDQQQVLRIGLSAGIQQRRLDWDKLVFGDQLNSETGAVDPQGNPISSAELRPDQTSIAFADFGAGLLYAGKVAYAGVTVDHLTTPDDRLASRAPGGFYRGYPMRTSVHAGAQIKLNANRARSSNFITPNVLYTRQGPSEQLNIGAYAGFGKVFGGLWFRHAFGNPDAAIGVVGVEWDMYKIGYSYDATVSSLSTVSSGTHEVSVLLNFEKAWWIKRRRQANRYNDCLQLFR